MKKNELIRKRNTLTLIAIFLTIIAIAGFSYAYFNLEITGNDVASKNIVKSGDLSISIDSSNAFNINGLMPGDSYSTIFVVTNTGDQTVNNYNIYFSELQNTYLYGEVVYSISCIASSGSCDGKSQTPFGTDYSEIIVTNSIPANSSHTYKIIVSWLETGSAQNYNLNKELSYKITINETNEYLWSDECSNNDSRLSCQVVAKEGGITSIISKSIPDFASSANDDQGMFATSDVDGNSTYYYRGAIPDNYVEFSGKIWRIVRINSDGTVRLVLNDYAKDGSNNIINVNYNNSASCASLAVQDMATAVECVKYGYGTYSSDSIKSYVNDWYSNNITNDADAKINKEASFCNDYSYAATEFGAYYRLNTNKQPSLTCTAPSGYTNGEAKLLSLSVGLLTADEIAMAGGVNSQNNSDFYLFIGDTYWSTMSPYQYQSSEPFYAKSGTIAISSFGVSSSGGYRPVINLKFDTLVTGDGSSLTPYNVVGD